MKFLQFAVYIAIVSLCITFSLSACKPEQASIDTTTASETQAVTTAKKTPIQLAQEQLEQYGGAAGMIESIESFIEEHGVVNDIRDLYVLEPLIRLYYNFTEEELQEHFSVSQSDIEGAVSRVAGKISDWTLNAESLASLIVCKATEERVIALIDTAASKLGELNKDLFVRTAAVKLYEQGGMEKARRHVLSFIRFRIDELRFDIYPCNAEYLPDLSALDDIKGKAIINFNYYEGENRSIEIYGSRLQYEALPYADIKTPLLLPSDFLITAEWMDAYFGDEHSEPELLKRQQETNISILSFIDTIYRSTTDKYVDYLLVGQFGTYIGVRYYTNLPEGAPDISQTVECFYLSEWIYADIEKYKAPRGDAFVSDAYVVEFTGRIMNQPDWESKGKLIIPMINDNTTSADELNRKIKHWILEFNSVSLSGTMDYMSEPVGFYSDIYYEWYMSGDIAIIFIYAYKDFNNNPYAVYFYDTVNKIELSYSEYRKSFDILWDYFLDVFNNEKYIYTGGGTPPSEKGVKLTYSDIEYIIALDDGSFDIYTCIKDSTSPAYHDCFKVTILPKK